MSDSSEITPNLSLPVLLPSQAQKHVTHNAALERLDLLTQLTVRSASLQAPPPGAEDGDRYIVGPGATGPWAGQERRIAALVRGAWLFLDPQEGWIAHVAETGLPLVFQGLDWHPLMATPPEQVASLGISTNPDPDNRFSVSAAGTAFSHAGSDHKLKVNKALPGDTASLLFQTAWSSKAEIGLTGSDDLQFRVSADGTTFQTAMVIENGTGRVDFPAGGAAPRVAQLRNSDVTTDINTPTLTDVPISGIADILDATHFSVSGNGITCLSAGRVRVTANLHVYSDILRPNLNVQIAVNGAALPGAAASGYIRSQNYHNESSFHLCRYVEVNANDIVSVQAVQEAAEGPVTMTSGNSILLLEQW